MHICPKSQLQNSINPSLLAFKPRQVLLAKPGMKLNKVKKEDDNKAAARTLKPDEKARLLHSIAGYLGSNGFSKTLKKFRSEAQIEKDDFSDSSLDLEVMYCKYLEAGDQGSTDFSREKVQDPPMNGNSQSDKGADFVFTAGGETVGKKKKKRSAGDIHADSKETANDEVPELNVNSKEKRKSKKLSASLEQAEQVSVDAVKEPADDMVCDPELPEPVKKQKEKKKKKSKSDLESKKLDEGKSSKAEAKNADNKTSEEDVINKDSQVSKKRKRPASEENNSQPIDQKGVEESKRRKTEGSEEPRGSEQVTEEKNGEKSAKTPKKQVNGSAEPKSVNAFQRVKVEEVVFTDERLKDNSYWAKDGAEIGYGAKAQEVLGQVRGRDFRHEKTKKKRGSYRGGMIDLNSHSIKFNYSDED